MSQQSLSSNTSGLTRSWCLWRSPPGETKRHDAVSAITALQSQAGLWERGLQRLGMNLSSVPSLVLGDSACCCQKLPSGCIFQRSRGEEEEKDFLKVPMAPSQVLISTDWLLSLIYPDPGSPVLCLCSPSNKGFVYIWMILIISLANTTTVFIIPFLTVYIFGSSAGILWQSKD